MTVTVTPSGKRNTHHIKLSDGVTDLGLILCDAGGNEDKRGFTSDPVNRQSIKMYSGEQRHSDLEPPWEVVVQDEFSGGRGGEKYEIDTSKYWDSRQVDTTNPGVVLAPMEIWDKGTAINPANTNWPMYASTSFARRKYTNVSLWNITPDYSAIAVPFTAAIANPTNLYFWAKKTRSPTNSKLDIYIYTDSLGAPNTQVANAYTNVSIDKDLRLYRAVFASVTLTPGTAYWLIFAGDTFDVVNLGYYTIIGDGDDTTSCLKGNSDTLSSWTAAGVAKPYYHMTGTGVEFRAHFAEIRGSLIFGAEYKNGSTSKVFQDGIAGVATAGAAGYLRDANRASGIVNDWHNTAIIRIMQGTGHHLPSPWRFIEDTLTANSEMQVEPDWSVAPDATSWYAVIGGDRWIEVTGHGLGANEYITDAIGINGAIYFACGPGVVARRFRHYWTGTTYFVWTNETGYATFFEKLIDAATNEIWIANRTVPAQIQKASGVDCTGTGAVGALSFGSAINCGDLGEKITGMVIYGEDTPQLYVFKEGSIYRVVNEVPQELRISGMRAAADERNGYASAVSGVYLYFSFLDSIERYYSGSLDNISPNKDGGMPYDRRGMASSMAAYPGILYTSIDGGNHNYSSIIAWNGQGYHEVWRAPAPGIRIYGDIYIQPLPGDNADRLYFSWNGNIISLTVVGNPYDHNSMGASENFQYYCYAPGGYIETGWIHMGLEEVTKLFNSVKVVGENLGSSRSQIYLDYKLDDDSDYTEVGQFTITNDTGELELDSATYNIIGRRIRLRIRMETLYNNSTPKITAILLEGLKTVPNKQRAVLTFRLKDYGSNLLGEPEDTADVDTTVAKLREWADYAGTIGMSAHVDELNGKRVKLDRPVMRVRRMTTGDAGEQNEVEYIFQMGVWIID